MNIKFRNKYIEVKYCVSSELVTCIIITNNWQFRIFEIRRYGCWLVGCFGFNGPLRQYIEVKYCVSCELVTCIIITNNWQFRIF